MDAGALGLTYCHGMAKAVSSRLFATAAAAAGAIIGTVLSKWGGRPARAKQHRDKASDGLCAGSAYQQHPISNEDPRDSTMTGHVTRDHHAALRSLNGRQLLPVREQERRPRHDDGDETAAPPALSAGTTIRP
jgi:hypothetical protein